MRKFEEFVSSGIVKKRNKDFPLSRSLIESAKKRKSVMEKYIPLNEETANKIVEESYDVIRELLEAILAKEGYKTYSHEATISYLSELKFKESEIKFLDELRKTRHGLKYYGENIDLDYADKVMKFMINLYEKLREIALVS